MTCVGVGGYGRVSLTTCHASICNHCITARSVSPLSLPFSPQPRRPKTRNNHAMPRSTANNLRTHRPLHDDQGSALISLTTDLGPRTCFLSQLLWNCVWHGQLRQCFGTPTGKSQVDFGEGQNRWGDGQFDARCREYAAPCQHGHAERSDHVYRALLAGSVRFVWRDGRVGAQQIRRRCLHSRLLLVQVAFEHPAVDDRCEERVHQSRRLVGVFCH